MGYEQMENRGPFCFLAAAVSGQSHQREQGHWQRPADAIVRTQPQPGNKMDNRISGNKVIGKGRLPTNNPITIALKMAATTLRLSKTYLGAQFRRLRTRLEAP